MKPPSPMAPLRFCRIPKAGAFFSATVSNPAADQQRHFNPEMLGGLTYLQDNSPRAIIGGDFTAGYVEQDRLIWK